MEMTHWPFCKYHSFCDTLSKAIKKTIWQGLFISLLWPGLYYSTFLFFWTCNYICSSPVAWTLHLIFVYGFIGCNPSSFPPLLCLSSVSLSIPLHRHNAVLLSLFWPKPQACTRDADKDTNTNWQPLGQARMIETVSVAGRRNSRKRTNTVLLLPT